MSREMNIEAQERIVELIAHGDIDDIDEVFANEVIDHDPAPGQGPGVEGIKGFWRALRGAFPDLSLQLESLVADENRVVVVLTITGTHRGNFQGVEPTGKPISVRGIQMGRFENAKIVERWGATDEIGIMEQICAWSA